MSKMDQNTWQSVGIYL